MAQQRTDETLMSLEQLDFEPCCEGYAWDPPCDRAAQWSHEIITSCGCHGWKLQCDGHKAHFESLRKTHNDLWTCNFCGSTRIILVLEKWVHL